jgi:short-subunit dehydrogenase
MISFSKSIAVVTGAAGGIGRAFAVELGRRRAAVVLADIDEAGAERTAELVRRTGGRALVVRCDVAHPPELAALAEATVEWAGTPDLVVLNAGILAAGELHRVAADDLDRLVAINVLGVAHGCRVFAPLMVARGRGSILNVGSLAGLVPVPLLSAYAATKAAVVGLSESLHAELRPRGVGVTVLCPSFTRTELVARAAASDDGIRRLGQRLLDTVGSRPETVVAAGLHAAARGRLYAVDTLHGRVAWGLARLAPTLAARLAGLAAARVR